MMNQSRGALAQPAVQIPPELAAMSYEDILALLQAQQGALQPPVPGFMDGGPSGDSAPGDAPGDATGSSENAGPGGSDPGVGSTGGATAAGGAESAPASGIGGMSDQQAADMVSGLSADLQAGEVLGGVPSLGSLADFATATPAPDILGGILGQGHLGKAAAAAKNGDIDRAVAELGFLGIGLMSPIQTTFETVISNFVEPALEAVLGDKSPTPGFENGAQPGHPGIGDEAYPSDIAPQGALDPTQTAAGPTPSESWLDRWMGPQQAANGGALGYANGGKVPAGAHVIPADVVAAKGNGSSRAGALAYKPLGGKLVDGAGDGRSDSVPAQGPRGALRLSRDEVVIPPQGVRKAGGHGALAQDTVQTRQQFRQHLGALPPPRGSREHGKRNGGAFAEGGEVEPRRGTTGQMRRVLAGTDADVEYAPATDPTMDAIRGWAAENPLDAGALALSPVPVVGDVAGFANDLRHYATDPESRNALNYSLTALGLLPFVPALTFAGVGAKTANMAKLAQAQKLESAKAPREQILAETGWFKGPDEKWRFEIDDSASKLKRFDATKGNVSLSDVLHHPELEAAYPHLFDGKSVRVEGYGPGSRALGAWDGDGTGGVISLRTEGQRPWQQHETLLHEVTHGVQAKEGFSPGGSAAEFANPAAAEIAREALSFRQEMARLPKGMDSLAKENAIVNEYRQSGLMDMLPSREARDLAKAGVADEELEALVRAYGLDRGVEPLPPHEIYRRLAGEAEARNVPGRLHLEGAERTKFPPWTTLDVPENDLIVRGALPPPRR